VAAGPVICVQGLRKTYARHEAVRGLDLEVDAGEIFGFLGPNGAGKSTTFRWEPHGGGT
jgi:ABC-2 type transport system ATP-binding protein